MPVRGLVTIRVQTHTAYDALLSFLDIVVLGMTSTGRRSTAEMLAVYISRVQVGTLRTVCRSMAFVEFQRQGMADVPRVGDRMLSASQRQLRSLVLECIVEGIRAGIQTGFYTWQNLLRRVVRF